MPEIKNIAVYKLGLNSEVTWQYKGRVLERDENIIQLEAFFDRDDSPFMGITLKRGDRFVETFYSDRWYNVFEIYDRDNRKHKGWYCNIGYPAVFKKNSVSYIDLALDLWVAVDGTQTVLDEDEFLALAIDVETRAQALVALNKLQKEFAQNKKPPA